MNWKQTILYLGGSIVLLAFLVETGLRVGLGLGTPPLLQADSTIGYVFQANQETYRFGNRVHINEYHQRSEDLPETPDTETTRVLFLGDSVTWGGVLTGQLETIPEETEEILARQCDTPVEALNASAGSWSIGNLEAYIERFGVFRSDTVVLQIGTHDLTQPKSKAGIVGKHPSFPNENPTLAIEELITRYLWPRLQSRLPDLGGAGGPSQSNSSTAQDTGPADQLTRNLAYLRSLVNRTREANTPVAILHTPNRGEVTSSGEGPTAPQRRAQFLRVADSLEVPVVNLVDGWAGRAGTRKLYRDHVHLNQKGNRAIADILAKFLKRQSIFPCE